MDLVVQFLYQLNATIDLSPKFSIETNPPTGSALSRDATEENYGIL